MPTVSGVLGMWMVMKSDCASSSSRVTSCTPSWAARARGDVGVVREDLGVEALQAGRDEGADPAEADDADLLLEELDAGVLGALPLARLERGAATGM